MLTFSEFEETLLDVECFMNNRPLAYLGEEFEDRAGHTKYITERQSSGILRRKYRSL